MQNICAGSCRPLESEMLRHSTRCRLVCHLTQVLVLAVPELAGRCPHPMGRHCWSGLGPSSTDRSCAVKTVPWRARHRARDRGRPNPPLDFLTPAGGKPVHMFATIVLKLEMSAQDGVGVSHKLPQLPRCGQRNKSVEAHHPRENVVDHLGWAFVLVAVVVGGATST